MVILIAGATHTGKTALSQKLTEKYKIPYMSIDHLKMGLIRSGQTKLTTEDDEELTPYLWSIVKEIIKTVIENGQNLIIEGCYIPFDWQKDFDGQYLSQIKYRCLVMTENYIRNNVSSIKEYESAVEKRLKSSDFSLGKLIEENRENLSACKKYNLDYILIDDEYEVDYVIE